PPPTVYPLGSCLAAALPEDRRSLPGQGSWSAGAPILRLLITWTRLGSLRSPGDPSRAFAAFLDPGRIGVSSSWRPRRCCPPLSGRRGLRHWLISRLTPAALAPALLRFALPLLSRARLASGWLTGLYREGVEPLWTTMEGFSSYSRPSSFPVLLTLPDWRVRDRALKTRVKRAYAAAPIRATNQGSWRARWPRSIHLRHGPRTRAGVLSMNKRTVRTPSRAVRP